MMRYSRRSPGFDGFRERSVTHVVKVSRENPIERNVVYRGFAEIFRHRARPCNRPPRRLLPGDNAHRQHRRRRKHGNARRGLKRNRTFDKTGRRQSQLSLRNETLGVCPMAGKSPEISSVRSGSPAVFRQNDPVTLAGPFREPLYNAIAENLNFRFRFGA